MITDARDSEDDAAGAPAAEELTFRGVTGRTVRVKASFGPDETGAPAFLAARPVRLADGNELRQLWVADTADQDGYQRLDNEILAGRRLFEVTHTVGYPPEVSRLFGDEANSANPYALLEPYRAGRSPWRASRWT